MRAPISVIIPTLNAAGPLHDCLSALMEGLDAGLIRELIVSDGGSSDATVEMAEAWGANVIGGPASRGGQLKRGCAAAQADWLLILHADTVLSPGWTVPVGAFLVRPGAGWFKLRFDSGGLAGRIVAHWANLRSRLGLPYGDQGLLVHRSLYRDAGGYPDQPLMEDVALARGLRGKLQGIDVIATTSAERYRRQGWLRRGGRNLWMLARYFSGAKPQDLARGYSK